MKRLLEIAAFSAEAAILAADAGADRIELCSGYAEGGLTPTLGTISFVKVNVRCPVFVMIRPRGGNFCYSELELELMCHDIERCKEAGADGIVVGALNEDFSVNTTEMETFVRISAPLPVTFHRAFDRCYEPFAAMETLIDCGVKRILTSGQKPAAMNGSELLRELHKKANNRIIIMPGAGINPGNIAELAKQTGCTEYHASARRLPVNADPFGFGEHILPHPEFIAQMKEQLK